MGCRVSSLEARSWSGKVDNAELEGSEGQGIGNMVARGAGRRGECVLAGLCGSCGLHGESSKLICEMHMEMCCMFDQRSPARGMSPIEDDQRWLCISARCWKDPRSRLRKDSLGVAPCSARVWDSCHMRITSTPSSVLHLHLKSSCPRCGCR